MIIPYADAPLKDIGVLVTRPPEQARGLMDALRQWGGSPLLFPALAILPPRHPEALAQTLARLDRFQLAIFISPTAALRGVDAVKASGGWPAGLAVAAVGKGTARALADLGMTDVLTPASGFDSEHLLALPQFRDMEDKSVIVFRGEGGREVLADTLAARGARVAHAVCYRRGLPEDAAPAPVLEAFATGRIQAVTAYSGETLDNLFLLLGKAGEGFLKRTPLFVPHPRIAAHAAALGIETVITAPEGEGQLLASLVEYFSHG